MKEALKNQINQGLGIWAILWTATVIFYFLGLSPLQVPPIIAGDIIIPIVVLLLLSKYKREYGSFLK